MKKLTIYLLLLLAGICRQAAAQTIDRTVALQYLSRLQAPYEGKALAFDIAYKYSNESKPGVTLDSLKGRLEVQGNKYRYLIDSTIMLSNDQYNIMVFKTDQLIVLSKPKESPVDLTVVWNMLLDSASIQSYAMVPGKKDTTMIVTFLPDQHYKKMTIHVDNKSRYITAVEYVVQTSMLMDEGQDPGKGYDPYARISIAFSNYLPLSPDPERFSESAFVIKEGSEFKPSSAYKNFKIFKGSPNL
ncbi:hypothetical protein [Chitinophaga sp. Cy-1792]|uniref:hypothetical protein n=1 Tax=Chitinophaga sp. Cy-1792 TaxID=2608339 RepID=UPI001421E18B|nr:hypothetical protein [Chitinophaga sp. Cy-1792]NIG52802.1 hypothetical protein [Chitinophaga sp. Cy-1792]